MMLFRMQLFSKFQNLGLYVKTCWHDTLVKILSLKLITIIDKEAWFS